VASGSAGNVTINASDAVEVSGRIPNSLTFSTVSSSAPLVDPLVQQIFNLPPVPSGTSGNVTINTRRLTVTNGGQVSVRNDGTGNAGTLFVNAPQIFLNSGGSITAATAAGNGGEIAIDSSDLRLADGASIAATAGSNGNGGNVNIDTDTITLLDNSNITANAVFGNGGNVTIDTQGLFQSPDSAIAASSQFGLDGTVQIDTSATVNLNPVEENQGIASGSGIVTIKIVEGQLEAINVEGSDRLANYVRSRIPKGVVNRDRLLEALSWLHVDPSIEKISATLAVGSQPGLSQLNVEVKPKDPLKVIALADNYRSPTAGSFERGIELSNANLLLSGDDLSLNYRNTDGSNYLGASYKLPINRQNGTIEVGYSQVDSDIIERPFNQLDIVTAQRSYQLTYRQPLLRKATEDSTSEFALGLTLSRSESSSQLLGFDFPISPGADESGKTRISAVRFFQDFKIQSSQDILAARSELSLGVGAFGATINAEPPDSRFVLWRGQVGYLRKLGATSLLLRGNIQLADRPLVPLEQFGLGGEETVRGYRQDFLIADNGVSASAELYVPLFDGDSGKLQVVPFVELGTTWNNDRSIEGDTNTLASLGLGLQYSLSDRFNARIDYAFPLIDVDSRGDTWQENGFTFSVQYQPF
jgi:hemolysin activation/secretion protein